MSEKEQQVVVFEKKRKTNLRRYQPTDFTVIHLGRSYHVNRDNMYATSKLIKTVLDDNPELKEFKMQDDIKVDYVINLLDLASGAAILPGTFTLQEWVEFIRVADYYLLVDVPMQTIDGLVSAKIRSDNPDFKEFGSAVLHLCIEADKRKKFPLIKKACLNRLVYWPDTFKFENREYVEKIPSRMKTDMLLFMHHHTPEIFNNNCGCETCSSIQY